MELTRERQVTRRPVIEIVVRHRSKDGVAVGELSQSWQIFANPHAGNRRRLAAEGATHLEWSGRFGVPGFKLARPPPQKTTRTDLARAADEGLAELKPGNSAPIEAGTPMRNQSRRDGREPAKEGRARKGTMGLELEPGVGRSSQPSVATRA